MLDIQYAHQYLRHTGFFIFKEIIPEKVEGNKSVMTVRCVNIKAFPEHKFKNLIYKTQIFAV